MAKTILPDGRVIEEPPQFAGPAVPAFPGMGDMQVTFNQPMQGEMEYPGMPMFMEPPGGYLPQWTPQYNDTMFGELFAQSPFPQELVPPFRVEPGLTGDPDALFGMFLNNQNFRPASFIGANVDLGQYGATTREVQPEELVSEQLNSLLRSGSDYMRDAIQRGSELAQDRGALSSSIFAGAAQRSAYEAALPVASANAQAYIQAASENMNALNQNTLARMQAAVNLAISNSQTAAQVSIANTNASVSRENALISLQGARLAAESRERITETTLNAQFTMQQVQFLQDQLLQREQLGTQVGIANLQAGTSMFLGGLDARTRSDIARMQDLTQRYGIDTSSLTQREIAEMQDLTQRYGIDTQASTSIRLADMDAELRTRLTEMGIEGQLDLSRLTHAQAIEIQEMFLEPRWRAEYQLGMAQTRSQLQTNILSMWAQGISSMNGLELDDAARSRGQQFWNNWAQSAMNAALTPLDPNNWDFDFDRLFGGGG